VGCPIVGRLSYDNIIGGVLLNWLNYKESEFIREFQQLKDKLPNNQGKSGVNIKETGQSNQRMEDGMIWYSIGCAVNGCSKIRRKQKMRQLQKLTMWRVAASSYESQARMPKPSQGRSQSPTYPTAAVAQKERC
jgi:hypothetical protein